MSTYTIYTEQTRNVSQLVQTRDAFGPAAYGRFDFTPLFEDTILSIVPSVILVLAVPPRIWVLLKQRVKVAKSPLHESKMVSHILQPVKDHSVD